MKMFENPEIEVIRFSVEDIMSASGGQGCSADGNCPYDFSSLCPNFVM